MTIESDNQDWKKIEAILNDFIQIDAGGKRNIDFNLKLDLLGRTLETLRIKRKTLDNKLPVEEFLQGDRFVDTDCIRFMLPEKYTDPGSGTPPIRLQPKLLLFLLLYHQKAYRVLDIIKHFIDKVWDQLEIIDFKKTQTGVFRCYTNTRFAAKTLRAYGLLRFTRKEAYKTWVLSLPGFLVGSVVLDKYQHQWTLPKHRKIYNFDLHEEIWNAWSGMRTYDDYLRRLTTICEPNTDIFTTFEPVLEKAYDMLADYWKILRNHDMTVKERHTASVELLKRIETLPSIDQFYRELSKSINLDRLLSEL